MKIGSTKTVKTKEINSTIMLPSVNQFSVIFSMKFLILTILCLKPYKVKTPFKTATAFP